MAKLLIAGATGLVGRHALLQALADDRVTQLVAPTRRPLAAHPKLLNPLIDSNHLPLDAPWWAVDGALSALGTTRAKAGSAAAFRAIDFDYTLAIARQLREAGVKRFALTSSMGANARSRSFYLRVKGEIEEAIAQLGFSSYTIIRAGPLGGERDESRFIERLMGGFLSRAGPILPPSIRINPASAVAAFLIDAALSGAAGQHLIGSAQIARSGL
ncbi:NAD(P)H-binding protein [Sphingobium subterraneum]|uniref:Uncharacterized protein YbjT (DUF2867 family) n=1 Tax=Sphingobium subterraneum TaxID=627688 RepID=A0A841IX62_9SPHN|nr:NAD(P)H-binding protein [Sphingobium subterraneum]MBB6122732.1 uncharacterized protein YbjT (DUF2867 family) [Sphingobium subterraneum]